MTYYSNGYYLSAHKMQLTGEDDDGTIHQVILDLSPSLISIPETLASASAI